MVGSIFMLGLLPVALLPPSAPNTSFVADEYCADDIVHTLGAILYYRGTARDMLAMPWYHPTLSEVLLSLARQLDAQVSTTASV